MEERVERSKGVSGWFGEWKSPNGDLETLIPDWSWNTIESTTLALILSPDRDLVALAPEKEVGVTKH